MSCMSGGSPGTVLCSMEPSQAAMGLSGSAPARCLGRAPVDAQAIHPHILDDLHALHQHLLD